ncbi:MULTISPECIES: Fic family protein [unclassified Microbacterium]|uniref:Fic family protein n=1 Tax=unclassified Microbacterium TaxID=2609290 RepID=UPI00178524F0|nr:Fic family protein [Microbacterium sp. CFBP 8801]MBD8477279.1 Fic family protein [Microbacterium sp. CFBP 8794]MBD8508885.1 Fic family protein [Microbacterium sp. CFBP 8790]
MTPLEPGYGETPLDADEADALTSDARALLGVDPTRADIYDAEQAISDEVGLEFATAVVSGQLALAELLSDAFVRELHRRLYEDIWEWAGVYRLTEKSVGIDPVHISVELRSSLDTILYRWTHTDDWSPRQLGIAVHADVVRIHPFVDGNGRTTRLLADLVHYAAQSPSETLSTYDWSIDKKSYVTLLHDYDQTRDASRLAAFIPVTEVA